MTATAMAREIAEQPEAVRRTLAAHLSRTDEIAALALPATLAWTLTPLAGCARSPRPNSSTDRPDRSALISRRTAQ